MRDEKYDDMSAKQSLPPAVRTNGTVNGTGVDTTGTGNFFRSAMLIVNGGTITDGTHTVTLQESDDNTTFTAVAAGDLIGSLVAVTTNSIQRQAYMGSKRYIRASIVVAGATSGGATSASILLSSGSGAPVT